MVHKRDTVFCHECLEFWKMSDTPPHPWIKRVVASEEQIRLKVKELAARINEDYKVPTSETGLTVRIVAV